MKFEVSKKKHDTKGVALFELQEIKTLFLDEIRGVK